MVCAFVKKNTHNLIKLIIYFGYECWGHLKYKLKNCHQTRIDGEGFYARLIYLIKYRQETNLILCLWKYSNQKETIFFNCLIFLRSFR